MNFHVVLTWADIHVPSIGTISSADPCVSFRWAGSSSWYNGVIRRTSAPSVRCLVSESQKLYSFDLVNAGRRPAPLREPVVDQLFIPVLLHERLAHLHCAVSTRHRLFARLVEDAAAARQASPGECVASRLLWL